MWSKISFMKLSPPYCLWGSHPWYAFQHWHPKSSKIYKLFERDVGEGWLFVGSFYTRLFKIKDPVTTLPVFAQLQVALACNACREIGMAAQCKHMLHLVPQWQSSARHERLKAVMADRPDLIQSELAVSLLINFGKDVYLLTVFFNTGFSIWRTSAML